MDNSLFWASLLIFTAIYKTCQLAIINLQRSRILTPTLGRNYTLMLKIPAQISKVETTSDGGLKLVVHTQEIVPSDKAEVMNLHSKIGWFVFSETNIEPIDIPDEPVEFDGQKSLSERLRNTLFRLYEAQGGKPEDFEAYRSRIMERLISTYKDKIADLTN